MRDYYVNQNNYAMLAYRPRPSQSRLERVSMPIREESLVTENPHSEAVSSASSASDSLQGVQQEPEPIPVPTISYDGQGNF